MNLRVLPKRTAVLLLLCISLPLVTASGAPQPVTLRYKFTPGQVTHTKVTMDFNYNLSGLPGSASPAAVKMHTTQVVSRTVQSVAADGSATLLLHQDSADSTFSISGTSQPLPAEATAPRDLMTLIMTPTGKVVSSQMASVPGTANPMQGMDMSKMEQLQGKLDFPTAPQNIGDTWKGSAALDKTLSGTALSGLTVSTAVQSTLTSLSPDGMASINQTVIGTFSGGASPAGSTFQMDGTMSGAGTYTFDTAAGQDAGYSGAYTMNIKITTPQMASPLTIQGQMSVRRDPLPAK